MKECVSKKTILKKNFFFCLFKLSQLIFTWFGTFGKLAGYFDVKIAIMISYSYNYYPPLCLSNISVSNSRNETFYLENKFLHWKKLIWGIFSREWTERKNIQFWFFSIFSSFARYKKSRHVKIIPVLLYSLFLYSPEYNHR